MKKVLFFSLLILFCVFFLGIGYASVSSISFEIDGSASLNKQTGVYISNVVYTSNIGADLTNSYIVTNYQTLLGNKTTLSTSNANSNIVYTVTVKNDETEDMAFKGIEYDPDFYDNNDIEVVVGGMNVGDIVTPGNTVTFTVTFKYKSGVTPSNNNNVLNSYVNFKFGEPEWVDLCDNNSIYLRCRMTSQTIQSDASINFSAYSSASNGRGLYYTSDLTKTEDLDGDGVGEVVYYYRGNVTNNYVRFDSYCWRIVRTNEDGSIRLIYGGTPTNQGNCPQTGSAASINNSTRYNNYTYYDNAYMGYMYGTRRANSYAATHANTNNSTVKTTIDNWYNTNLRDSASYLADYPFCNDRTVGTGTGIGTNTTEYATQVRFYGSMNNQIPTFKCNQANDKFSVSNTVGNGALTYPIALLSADEAVFAGAPYNSGNTNNTDSYLYTASTYWLMSPGDIYNNGVYVYFINNSGQMRMYTTTQQIGVRPVINLLPGVTISGGTGAYNSPFVVNGVDTTINSSGISPQNSPSPPENGMGSVRIEEIPIEANPYDIR